MTTAPALFPAIDILGGRCVRLFQGDYEQETVYGNNPAAQARAFQNAGATWVHVVDLDAARTGDPVNRQVVAEVAAALYVPVQAGGGVRTLDDARILFDVGVSRVVMGTAAIEAPNLVDQVADLGRVAVGLDIRGEEVAVRGWTEGSGLLLTDAFELFSSRCTDAFVITQIERDGTLQGPDLEGLAAALAPTDIDVVASGGVATLDNLRTLRDLPVAGAIVGKAIYEEAFTVSEAVRVFECGDD